MRKTAVVTGTTHGIGRVTARELARANCRVVMLVRDHHAGERVRQEIEAAVPAASLGVVACDLASLASVRRAAEEVLKTCAGIDILINNAGIVSMSRQTTADGFELTFGTNHLGPFLLTELLRDRMPSGGRVVNVSSRMHFRATLDLGQVEHPDRKPYRSGAAYAQSKLANVLHTFALARRVRDKGLSVSCLHPGVVRTCLLPAWLRAIKPLISPGIFDAERGARTTLYLALDPGASGLSGVYVDEHQQVQAASRLARSEALQEALWVASKRWVGP